MENVVEMIDGVMVLCEYFEVKKPVLVHAKGRSACYYPAKQQVRISSKYYDAKWVYVHELTHHIDYQVNRNRFRRKSHDVVFFNLLCTVVELAYEKMSDYPWHAEYRTLYKWAVMKGYAKAGLNRDGNVPTEAVYVVRFNTEDAVHHITAAALSADHAVKQVQAAHRNITILSAKRQNQCT